MDSPPKKKHHRHHSKDLGGAEQNDEIQGSKKHHHHHNLKQRRKDTFKQELLELENVNSNDLLPVINSKKVNKGRVAVEAKFSSSESSQTKKKKKGKSKDLKSLVERKGSTGKITKIKKSSFGIEPNLNRIDLKKPTISPIGSAASLMSIRSPMSQMNLKAPKLKTSLEIGSYGSEGSRGGRDTPDDDYYDTEELRVLNHEKMVYLINKKTNPMVMKWKAWIARMDTFAAKHPAVFHNMCIKISVTMVPVLLLSLVWDSVAGFILEIPHYSMINHPGFMLVFHFISLPTAMYGYMMRSLMGQSNTSMSRWAVVAMLIHPLLLAYRCFMEWYFNGYRNQEKLHYEWFPHHHNFDEKPHSHYIFHVDLE